MLGIFGGRAYQVYYSATIARQQVRLAIWQSFEIVSLCPLCLDCTTAQTAVLSLLGIFLVFSVGPLAGELLCHHCSPANETRTLPFQVSYLSEM